MKKNYVMIKGFKIQTNESGYDVLKGDKKVAEIDKYAIYREVTEKGIPVRFRQEYDGKIGIGITEEERESLTNLHREERKIIEKWFDELDNVKIYCLDYSHYYINEETKGYKEMKQLNESEFNSVKQIWIRNNRKYFIKTKEERKQNDFGMFEAPKYYYIFKKENIDKIENEKEEYRKTDEYKEKMKKELEYEKFYELAEKLSDEDFEDITGLPRDHFII